MVEADRITFNWRHAGLDVWDVVELTSMYTFTNRRSSAMGHRPNDEYHHHDRAVPPKG